jgi:D-sedoheptulose 7-phosphate isomerase
LNASAIISKYLKDVVGVLERMPVRDIERVISVIADARHHRKRVFFFGNGGSAATASHFVCDVSKGAIRKDKPRIKAFCLSDNLPLLSAWANDTAYENVFAEQLENLIEAGDVAVAISGSGNSANVLKGVALAHEKGATTVGLTAFEGGKLKGLVDVPLVVPVHNMEQAEDVHLILDHIIAVCLRRAEDI